LYKRDSQPETDGASARTDRFGAVPSPASRHDPAFGLANKALKKMKNRGLVQRVIPL
jgi:hypothetical protein